MRNLLLGAFASVLLVSSPVLAAPLQINGSVALFGHPHQSGTEHQTITGESHVTGSTTEAVQVNVNAELASGGKQQVNDTQTVHIKGHTTSTQAVQVGVNAEAFSSTNQKLTQTQTVTTNGSSGDSVQIGANVAIGSSGGSQEMNASQTVK
jgi:hypothetical protein